MFGIFSTALRHKIWFDLWGAKQRTAQAILTIAIGSFAIGAIFGGWGGISEDTRRNFSPTRPPSLNIRLSPPADEALLKALQNDPRLAAVEGLMETSIRWRPGPGAPWKPATLQARDDYDGQRLSLIRLEGGAWPQGSQFAIERGYALALGERVQLEIDARTTEAPISGICYNLSVQSAGLGGNPVFYASRAQFARLTGQDRFGHIIATVPNYSPERAKEAASEVERALREYGFTVQPGSVDNTKVADPNRAFFQDPVEGVGLILQLIGVIAVALGLLLVYNTVTAIVTQQTSQIGELKAIGASSRQILLVYFALVFVYGLVALLISVPLGALAANGLRRSLITTLGLNPAPWIVLPAPILYQAAICLLAPLLVATIPVLQGARVTVREAISSYGLSGGGGRIDALLARARGLPRVVSLAFSNAFRNIGRIATTQLALAGAGVTFMAVISVRASLVFTLGGMLLQAYHYQVQLDLAEPASLPRIERASALPGVAAVEVWRQQSATVRRANAPEQVTDPTMQLLGVPVPTASYTPTLLRGRQLQPSDRYALVVHEQVAQDTGAEVGDWLLLSIPDTTGAKRWASQKPWQVVGVFLDPSLRSAALVPREALFAELGRREGNRVQVQSADASDAASAALAKRLRVFYEDQKMTPLATLSDTVKQRSDSQLANLSIVIGLLIVMALVVAVVGAISLNGVLSISVLERRREIGVLRAIGATPGTIRLQFVIEGLTMGLLSWLIALLFSYPVSLLIAPAIGATLHTSVIFEYSWLGVWLWLALASVIAIIASLSPAQQAIRTSVQESLAYE